MNHNRLPELLPWPGDALIIVASPAGMEAVDKMEGVHPAVCRRCAAAVHADTRSVRLAETHTARHGRPVDFLCWFCHLLYQTPPVVENHTAVPIVTADGRTIPPDKIHEYGVKTRPEDN